jgi:hypothetical protein
MSWRKPELSTPALNALLDFWLAKRGDGKPPVSAAISPVDLRPWVANIAVFEIVGDADFVYTYYGRALAAAFGPSPLGTTLDDLPGEQRRVLTAEYAQVRREGQPVARAHTADFRDGRATWERLVLPLTNGGGSVDKLIVAAYRLPNAPGVPA